MLLSRRHLAQYEGLLLPIYSSRVSWFLITMPQTTAQKKSAFSCCLTASCLPRQALIHCSAGSVKTEQSWEEKTLLLLTLSGRSHSAWLRKSLKKQNVVSVISVLLTVTSNTRGYLDWVAGSLSFNFYIFKSETLQEKKQLAITKCIKHMRQGFLDFV